MRLGAPVYDYSSAGEWAARHVEKGYGAAYWPLPADAGRALEREYVQAAAQHDLVIAEVGIWNNLLDPDAQVREKNIQYAIARLEQAERVGALCCVNISGSRSAVWDGPHPRNMTQETFDMIVETTQRIIDSVNPVHTHYALEPMPWAYPNDADSTRRLIRAINRPALGVHVDMCNMMSGCDRIFRSGELTREYFEAFGPLISSVHAKDVTMTAELTTHISETIPGQGVFDHAVLLRECAKFSDVCVMCEHLASPAEYDQAVGFLRGEAERLGLELTCAR